MIKDRQKEFVDNNKTICQENCDFSEYNDEEERANCSCYVEESIGSFANMNINKTKLYENFKDSKDKKRIFKFSYNILRCFRHKR